MPAEVMPAELRQLKPSQLKKRAAAAGATAQEIEEAEDAEDSRAALVTLILANEEAASRDLAMGKSALKPEPEPEPAFEEA
eukprot:COSAG06_NODE_12111_length_1422_cov_1.881330_1_plen_80_part_10